MPNPKFFFISNYSVLQNTVKSGFPTKVSIFRQSCQNLIKSNNLGSLRDELGILPPGDALTCIVGLSPLRDAAQRILPIHTIGGSSTGRDVNSDLLGLGR